MSTTNSPDPLPPNRARVTLPPLHVVGQTCLAVGTDVVWVPRVEKAWMRYGSRYLAKLFTDDELAYCVSQSGNQRWPLAQRLAARLAVKESIAKALGCGLNGLGYGQGVVWRDIESLAIPDKPPSVSLHGKAYALQQRAGIEQWQVSWSHDGDYAVAVVVGLGAATETH